MAQYIIYDTCPCGRGKQLEEKHGVELWPRACVGSCFLLKQPPFPRSGRPPTVSARQNGTFTRTVNIRRRLGTAVVGTGAAAEDHRVDDGCVANDHTTSTARRFAGRFIYPRAGWQPAAAARPSIPRPDRKIPSGWGCLRSPESRTPHSLRTGRRGRGGVIADCSIPSVSVSGRELATGSAKGVRRGRNPAARGRAAKRNRKGLDLNQRTETVRDF